MKLSTCCPVVISFLAFIISAAAQTSPSNSETTSASVASVQVPRLIRFSGIAKDETGKPLSGVLGITFALYQDEQGGAPLWLETQNVQVDTNGHYAVMLGADKLQGLPLDLFTSGEARWLGVRAGGQQEQPRVLLVSVPYAIKAHEAETLSGKSISDFVLLNDAKTLSACTSNSHNANNQISSNSVGSPSPPNGPTTFTGSNTTQIVGVTQSGSGAGLSATAISHAAVAGTITGPTNTAVWGLASNTSAGSIAAGVTGAANTQFGSGVQGVTTSSSGIGVQGVVNSSSGGIAVQGLNRATSGNSAGVSGLSASTSGSGVTGNATAASGYTNGVYGQSNSTNGTGVVGNASAKSGQTNGVLGTSYSPQGAGVSGINNAAGGTGVGGHSTSASGYTSGVYGQSDSTNGTGVNGNATAKSGGANGVVGTSSSPQGNGVSGINSADGGAGVNGHATAASGYTSGVYGSSDSTNGTGVNGNATAKSGYANGVVGTSSSPQGSGVSGFNSAGGPGVSGVANAASGYTSGVYGQSASTSGSGVNGNASATSGYTNGVYGHSASATGHGIYGYASATSGNNVGVAGFTESPSGTAGQFVAHAGAGLVLQGLSGNALTQIFTVDASGNGFLAGNLNVTGKLTKGSGSFKIDDPLDPANKYLSHSFVESPDMMNVYNGNITTDKHGLATVVLPEYFEALNRDFRYQLTVIGQFAQAIVAQKISNNRFVVRTSKPGVEVSWQVTGIRHDAYADAYRIPVEEEKPPLEQGHYLHPELFGASEHQAIGGGMAVRWTGSAPTRAGMMNLPAGGW